MPGPTPVASPGTRVGPYDILALLGSGGNFPLVIVYIEKGMMAGALLGELSNAQGGLVAASGMVLYHLLCSGVDAAADWYEKAIELWRKIAAMMNLPETMSQLS